MSNLLPSNMTRQQIAAFTNNDPRAIKAIEELLRSVNTTINNQTAINTRDIKSSRVLTWLSM